MIGSGAHGRAYGPGHGRAHVYAIAAIRHRRDSRRDHASRAPRGSRIATLHENAGAMFKDGLKNMAWGLSQQWIGGSQVMWLQEHVVLHHMHTGDVHMDPDAQMAPAMRGTISAF